MGKGPEMEQCSSPAQLLVSCALFNGLSCETVATTIVDSHLWVSVSPSVSPTCAAHSLPAANPTPMVPSLPLVLLSQPMWSATLPLWLFWLILSLIPWLSRFHAVWFSGASGCLLILDWLLSSFWLYEEAKGFYLHLHLGQNFGKFTQKGKKKAFSIVDFLKYRDIYKFYVFNWQAYNCINNNLLISIY